MQTPGLIETVRGAGLLLALFVVVKQMECRSYHRPPESSYQLVNTKTVDGNGCDIYANEPLHAVMDRVCEMCHEMFSHKNSNQRAECRKNCFGSNAFEKCMNVLPPMSIRIPRRRHSYIDMRQK